MSIEKSSADANERTGHSATYRGLTQPERPDPAQIIRRFEVLSPDLRASVNASFATLLEQFSGSGVPRHTPFFDALMTDFDEHHTHR